MQFHEMVNEYLQRLNAFPLPGARVHVQRHAHGRAGAGHGIFKGLAAILKKGLRLNMVHVLNRPYAEMMLGLESWIPLYMTGQIAPMVSARQTQQRIWASAVLFRRGGDGGRVHRRRFWARTLPLLPGEKRPALLPKAGRRPPANGAAADGHLPRCLRRRVQLVSVCQHARSRRIPRGADRASAAYAVGRMPYAPSEKKRRFLLRTGKHTPRVCAKPRARCAAHAKQHVRGGISGAFAIGVRSRGASARPVGTVLRRGASLRSGRLSGASAPEARLQRPIPATRPGKSGAARFATCKS